MGIKTTPSVVIRILLWMVLLFGGTWISIIYDLRYFKALFFKPQFHLVTLLIGGILLKFTFHAAAVGGRELARFGRDGDIPRLETNKLVTSGIYQCTRHPMLFGLMFIPMSVAFIVGSPTFMLVIAPLEMLFIFVMVWIFEERECREKFGQEYDMYARSVSLFPKTLHCIKKLFWK